MFLEKKMVTRRTVFGNASVRQAANQGIRRERRFEMLEVREMLAFSPLAGVNLGGASAAFADVNNDGFVDVHADAWMCTQTHCIGTMAGQVSATLVVWVSAPGVMPITMVTTIM